ncbi:unnamed protein product [Ceratitis capitata]|uniref:(Mediterranean fruit fly) hypothetical protein n=1 Tax=Ceratitis capitata TaxID=7213 RepID=A0A811UIB9_CERCA|nr:unnamed protein product [Ceratitis capitata]
MDDMTFGGIRYNAAINLAHNKVLLQQHTIHTTRKKKSSDTSPWQCHSHCQKVYLFELKRLTLALSDLRTFRSTQIGSMSGGSAEKYAIKHCVIG